MSNHAEIIRRLVTAAERREHHMGDVCSLLDAKAELAAAAKAAREALDAPDWVLGTLRDLARGLDPNKPTMSRAVAHSIILAAIAKAEGR